MTPLSRRTLLQSMGAAAVAAPVAHTIGCEETGACADYPALTPGPYYVEWPAERADITEGLEGAAMRMRFTVLDTGCQPIEGAVVDVWHAAPDGTYSGVEDATGETYLRGVQSTGADGVATFETVVPGWYPGRTTHVHFKVFVDGAEVLTSQAFFDEAVLSSIYATGAYAARGDKDTANDDDDLFDEAGTSAALFAMEQGAEVWTGAITVNVAT
jgi:protocatechuate 3,4-dioxygenase beta subunit